jgi:hypothetical protein
MSKKKPVPVSGDPNMTSSASDVSTLQNSPTSPSIKNLTESSSQSSSSSSSSAQSAKRRTESELDSHQKSVKKRRFSGPVKPVGSPHKRHAAEIVKHGSLIFNTIVNTSQSGASWSENYVVFEDKTLHSITAWHNKQTKKGPAFVNETNPSGTCFSARGLNFK